jgi:hypothetical protein
VQLHIAAGFAGGYVLLHFWLANVSTVVETLCDGNM